MKIQLTEIIKHSTAATVIKLNTWKIPLSEPVKRRLKRKKERPTVTVNCMKYKGGKDTTNQYTATYCFLQRKPKW